MKRSSSNFLHQVGGRPVVDFREVQREIRRRRLAMLVVALLHVLTFGVGVTVGAAFLSGCSEARDEFTTIDGGTSDATTDRQRAADGSQPGSDAGDPGLVEGRPDANGPAVGVDAGRDGAPRAADAGGVDGGDGGASATCRVEVALERCEGTDVYRCKVVSDDPTLTSDLHVSGCNAPDGTPCARCCPGTPAYLCPAVVP